MNKEVRCSPLISTSLAGRGKSARKQGNGGVVSGMPPSVKFDMSHTVNHGGERARVKKIVILRNQGRPNVLISPPPVLVEFLLAVAAEYSKNRTEVSPCRPNGMLPILRPCPRKTTKTLQHDILVFPQRVRLHTLIDTSSSECTITAPMKAASFGATILSLH